MAPADIEFSYIQKLNLMGIGELCLKDSPTDIMHLVVFPLLKETEADVAAEFYHQCQKLGLIVKMEVKLPSRVHRSGFMRADAVVFQQTDKFQTVEVVCAVEFKGHRKIGLNPESRQYKAYMGLGFPFFLCCGLSDIKETINDVVALADKLIET